MSSFQVVACVALECLHITNTNTSGCSSTVKRSRLCETKDVVQILESGMKATTPHQPGAWSWMKKGQSQATGSVLGAVLVERQEGRQPIKKPTPQSFSARTKLCTAQHPGISLKNCAMSLICRREVVCGRRPPVCWMSDRHAALLLLTVHLPQLRVPAFGTVFLKTSRLPHLYLHFGKN